MVVVALHQRLGTIHVGLLPSRILAHLIIGVAIAVRFMISLIHDVNTPAVAELVEVFAVGIVAGAQEIDVGLFHQSDVLLIGGIIDISPCLWVVVMAIHTTQFHVLAVNLEYLTHTLNALHAEVVVEMFDGVVLVVL